jgi:hypothetical protein
MIAEYEAARLDEDGVGTEGAESPDPEQTAMDQFGPLATIRSQLAR